MGEDWEEQVRAWDDQRNRTTFGRKQAAYPAWDRMTAFLRSLYYQRSIIESGLAGSTIGTLNVNLSPAVIEEGKARAGVESFMQFVHGRVARHINERVKRQADYWFAIELETKDKTKPRPHLHGAFAVHPDDRDLFRDALVAASRMRKSKAEPRAVVLDPFTDVGNWVEFYATKRLRQSREALGCAVLTASSLLRGSSKHAYEFDRASYRYATGRRVSTSR